jgi:hypothetical protein
MTPDKYTSPDRQLLRELAQAPKSIQPTLLKIATNEGTSVTSGDAGLALSVPFNTLQEALFQHQQAHRKDLTIALTILVSVMVITAAVIILLRG